MWGNPSLENTIDYVSDGTENGTRKSSSFCLSFTFVNLTTNNPLWVYSY